MRPAGDCGRFAPSATGPAHPGTLLAALLCWLDVRQRGGRAVLRLEDLDPERVREAHVEGLRAAMDWLGLAWDVVERQRDAAAAHAAALDRLEQLGLLYPSPQTRAQGAYANGDRGRPLPPGGWRAAADPVRVRLTLPALAMDEGGEPLLPSGDTAVDPIVRRRDGAIAYHLAGVVDDGRQGVTRIVRGRDLAASTALQVALRAALGLPTVVYRHHFLLLEARGAKLAKLHGAVGLPDLARRYDPLALTGWLAHVAGLQPQPTPCRAGDLVATFSWERVRRTDVLVRWDGRDLRGEEP